MNKKYAILTALAVSVLLIGGVYAYQILSVTSHINSVESQQLYYFDGATWQDLPLTATDLGLADMLAGSENPFIVKDKNNANRQLMITTTITNNNPDLKFLAVCQNAGTQYKIVSGGAWGEGLVIKLKVNANSEEAMSLNTIVSGDASVTTGYPINPVTAVERNEVDTAITDWTTC